MKRISKALPALAILSSALLTACGGGGTGSPTTMTFAGSVIDGYIEGATVCLDLNANLVCDSDEPTAITKADGTYSLDVTGLASDKLKLAHLITVVPDTAKDADDGGQTLKQAGKSSFSLLAPAAAYVNANGGSVTAAVISPFTTLVSHEMISGNNTLDTSEKYVRERLNLASDTNLRQDFVAKNDAALIEKAQMMTVAIGAVTAQALADTSKPTDNEALFASLTYLQTRVADLQTAYDEAKAVNSTGKPAVLVTTALQQAAAKPASADLLAEAKKTTSSAAVNSVVAVMEQGIYSADDVLGSCSESQASSTCLPNYWKLQASGGKLDLDQSFDLVNSVWKQVVDIGFSDSFYLTNKGWVLDAACPAGQSATYAADSAGGATISFCGGRTGKPTARVVDASGKSLSALGLNPPAGYANVTMPSGALLYWFEFASTQDTYLLWAQRKLTRSVSNAQNNTSSQVPFTSLDELISTYSTANAEKGTRFYSQGLQLSFDAEGTTTGGKLTLWSDGATAKKTGVATYERRILFGQEVLVIKAQAPYNDEGTLVIYAMKDGGLYSGDLQPASVKYSGNPMFNKTMVNAILKAGNKPAVLN